MKNLDNIIKRLNEILLPSIEDLQNLRKELGIKIQRGIIGDMMNAHTIAELNEIKASNEIWFQEWSVLSFHYEDALKRLKTAQRLRIEMFGIENCN